MKITIKDCDTNKCHLFSPRNPFRVLERHSFLFYLEDEKGQPPNGLLELEGAEDPRGFPKNIDISNGEAKFSSRFFEGNLGIYFLAFNGTRIASVDVCTDKITHKDAEDMFHYLFRKNENFLLNLYSLSKTIGIGSNEPDSLIQLTGLVKSLQALNSLLASLHELFPRFRSQPHVRLKPRLKETDYSSAHIGENSIVWLFQNLDSLNWGDQYKYFDDAIGIEGHYALPDKMASEEFIESFNLYENQIILGAIVFIERKLDEINHAFSVILENDDLPEASISSFNTIKRTIYRYEMQLSQDMKSQLANVKRAYLILFDNVTPKLEIPKLTHIFATRPHYSQIFKNILLVHNSQYSSQNLNISLGIGNIQSLYEVFTLFRLIDILEDLFGEATIESIRIDGLPASTKFVSGDEEIQLYYQYVIRSNSSSDQTNRLDLRVTNGKRKLCPDYIVVYRKRNVCRYCILDAKFTSRHWLEEIKKVNGVPTRRIGLTMLDLVWKYAIGITATKNSVQHPDYVWALYPGRVHSDSWDETGNIFGGWEESLPRIGYIPVTPTTNQKLRDVFVNMLLKWRSLTV